MSLHTTVGYADNHVAHSLEYANAAARVGASGLTADDNGRIARQTDDGSFWILTAYGGPTWVQLGGGASDPAAKFGPQLVDGFIKRCSFVHGAGGEGYVGYSPTGGGGWEGVTSLSSLPGHYGVVQQYIDATGDLGIYADGGGGRTLIPTAAQGTLTMKWVFRTPQLSDATDRFILRQGMTNNWYMTSATQWVALRYTDNENSGAFRLEYDAGSGTTYVDAGVTVAADTWYFCELALTQTAMKLYIDTSESSRTERVSVGSGMPTVALNASLFCQVTALGAPALVPHIFDDVLVEYRRL